MSAGPPFYRDLWGPGYDPNNRYPMSGDDVLAVRRVISRAGFMGWEDALSSNTYGKGIEQAVARFQTERRIQATGHYGQPTHEALRDAERAGYTGEPAWDAYSTTLYDDAIIAPKPTLAFKRDLWGPAYDPNNRYPMSGEDVVAVKRAISRAGFLPWETATGTNVYGEATEKAVASFQRTVAIQPTGHYGKPTHSALLNTKAASKHEWAWDSYSLKLYEGADIPTAGGAPRQKALDHLERRVGYTENPANSNTDSRSDGIHVSQDHTADGAHWLDRQPWCGCWCYYALEAAGVKGIDSSLASVANIEDAARNGFKCFKGWTTDRSKVKAGDLVVVGGYGVHVETVRGFDGSNTLTHGGNTSPGSSGSQSNGGGAFKRTRSPGEVRGYALVRYPGE